MNQSLLAELYDENATLEYKSHTRGKNSVWTTYTIASIDAPVNYDEGDRIIVYDVGSTVQLKESANKKIFVKKCMLYPLKVSHNGRIRTKYIAIQNYSVHTTAINSDGEIEGVNLIPSFPEGVMSVSETSIEDAISESSQ